jgi:glycosyltransferase involved in cell wall biosynthesis
MRINELVKDFSEKGYEITVLTGVPNYPEGKIFQDYKKQPHQFSSYYGAKIIRVPILPRGKNSIVLALNYISFFMSATLIGLFKLRKMKFDNILIFGYSPIMSAIPGVIFGRRKKTPVFIWILDLWPESLQAVGVIKNKVILKMVGKVVSWIYNRSDYILVQSNSFIESVKKYCTKKIEEDRLIYFPSWAEDVFCSISTANISLVQPDKNVLTLVFAGNIGEAQDFPTILNTVKLIKNKTAIRLIIAGDGRMFNWVKEQVEIFGLNNVVLLGRLPVESMPSLFKSADALLVSLKTNEIFAKTIPGKVQAYLASGKFILAMIDGEAAKVINDADAGLTSIAGDANLLAYNIEKLSNMTKSDRERMGENGKKYYEKHFSKDIVYAQLERLFLNSKIRE